MKHMVIALGLIIGLSLPASAQTGVEGRSAFSNWVLSEREIFLRLCFEDQRSRNPFLELELAATRSRMICENRAREWFDMGKSKTDPNMYRRELVNPSSWQ